MKKAVSLCLDAWIGCGNAASKGPGNIIITEHLSNLRVLEKLSFMSKSASVGGKFSLI